MNSERFAIRLMILQAVMFSAETVIIHQIGPQASVMQLALARAIGGLLLAFFFARSIRLAILQTRQLALQLLRGAVSLLYLWVMIYSFGHLPFADATAISYTQAAYVAIFSVLILGEAVSPSQWAAAGLGIFGALLIAKPTFASWSGVYLVALIGTSLNGLSFVLNRYLQREDSHATTMFYSNLVPLLGNTPVLFFAELPPSETLSWLPALLVLGPVGVYAGIAAVRYANAAMLGPYTLLRLVIAFAGAVVIFRELPGVLSSLGVVLIFASCLLASRNGTVNRAMKLQSARAFLRAPSFRQALLRAARLSADRQPEVAR